MRRTTAVIYVALLCVLVLLGLAVLHYASVLRSTQSQTERYEAATAWPVIQGRIEIARFREALARHVAGDPAVEWPEVLLRFDILWSRIPLLDKDGILAIDIDGLTISETQAAARPVLDLLESKLTALDEARGRMDIVQLSDELIGPLQEDIQKLLVGYQIERYRILERTRDGIFALGRQSTMTVSGFFAVACILLGISLVEANNSRRAERRFRHFATSASDLLWEVDENLKVTFVSDRKGGGFCGGASIAGSSAKSFGLTSWDSLTSAERDGPEWHQHLRDLREHRPFRHLRRRFPNREGTASTWEVSGTPVFDGRGRFRGYRGVASDITPKLAQEERIQYLAEHDTLTGLLNRSAMQQSLTTLLGLVRRRGRAFALLLLDLDGFKEVNDQHGHDVGDTLLGIVGERLRRAVPETRIVARTGGDEFAVAFEVTGEEEPRAVAERVAKRVLDRLQEPIIASGKRLTVGSSVGIALFPRDGVTIERLLKAADLALYAAKQVGPGLVRTFEPALWEESERRRELERALHAAIRGDAIDVHFQPLVCLRDGRTLAFEALARWNDPVIGPVSPGLFIPVAEQTGAIDELGRRVLLKACRAAASWQGALAGAAVSVNLSPAQFREDVAAIVETALAESGLAPSRLILEITETVLMEDSGNTLRTLNALSAQGVELAIDDFGAGYTSLAYLKKFPVHKIKLDRGFVRDLEESEDSRLIVEAMVKLAHVLNLTTVAEGVETEGQMRFLESVGCDQVQGFLLGRPAPLDEILSRQLRSTVAAMRELPKLLPAPAGASSVSA